ncbi:MAG: hypothetical protein ACPG77_19765 [Nannocystaceae bacterium]
MQELGAAAENSVLSPTMARIFIAQSKIDTWLSSGRIHIEQNILRVPAGNGAFCLSIEGAVFVERIDGGDPDVNKLAGKAKTVTEITAAQGEVYDTSLVLGDYAYTVKPGFIAIYQPGPGQSQLNSVTWANLRSALQALG